MDQRRKNRHTKKACRHVLMLISILLLCALCLSGCSKYASHYRAIGFVHSNTSSNAFMNFYSFDGDMAFRLKSGNASGAQLSVSAKLEEGSATVYYDDGSKKELFSIRAGEELETQYGPFESDTVYVIVQTDGTCKNGSFTFDMQ